jgi:hypothetical protein
VLPCCAAAAEGKLPLLAAHAAAPVGAVGTLDSERRLAAGDCLALAAAAAAAGFVLPVKLPPLLADEKETDLSVRAPVPCAAP